MSAILLIFLVAISPFFFKTFKSLGLFTIPVASLLALLQTDAFYGSVVGWHQSTELLYVALPYLLVVFVCMVAARALVLWRFNARPTTWKTVLHAVASLSVSLVIMYFVAGLMFGP